MSWPQFWKMAQPNVHSFRTCKYTYTYVYGFLNVSIIQGENKKDI